MASSNEHRLKADRNRRLLDSMDIPNFPEWAAVVAFYSALHDIERIASTENTHNGSHMARRRFLSSTKYRAIQRHYQALYDAAHIARYGTINQFMNAYPGDIVKTILIDVELNAIGKFVASFFQRLSPPTSQNATG